MRCGLAIDDQQQIGHFMYGGVLALSACDADLFVWDCVELGDHNAPNLHHLKQL